MTTTAISLLLYLRSGGHTVRRQGEGDEARIMIGTAETLTDAEKQAIKANRADLLLLLASEDRAAEMDALPEPLDPWGSDERQCWTPEEWQGRELALQAFIAWNAIVDARQAMPEERRQEKRAKESKRKQQEQGQELL